MKTKEALTEAGAKDFVEGGLPEGKSAANLWSSALKGFGLRLRKGGAASWVVYYRPSGVGRRESARTVTLGAYGKVALRDASIAARKIFGRIADGRTLPPGAARNAPARGVGSTRRWTDTSTP